MEYKYVDLGPVSAGSVVIMTISGTECNARLLDETNYSKYRRGQSFRGVMVHTQQSPVRLRVPTSGHWYAVADLGAGVSGRLGMSAKVIAAA